MPSKVSYPKVAMPQAMKLQGRGIAGDGQEDYVVAGSGDTRHQ